jgi:hypothetical protein
MYKMSAQRWTIDAHPIDRAAADHPLFGRQSCHAALSGAQKILGMVPELTEAGPGRQVSHDVFLIARRSAPRPEENVTLNGLPRADGGGLCPARRPSGTLQRL